MSLESVDRDEAIRRYRVEDAVAGVLKPAIDSLWPDTFAGLWITTPPKEFGVSVAFTSDAEAKVAKLRELFPFPEDLRGVQAAMPRTEMLSIQRRMIDDRTDVHNRVVRSDLPAVITATQGRYDLSTDIPTNNLVVSVEQASDELRDAFRSTYTSRIILSKGLAQPSACTQADCRYAMMGGLRLQRSSSFCSSAFSAHSKFDSSKRYVISAGHCQPDDELRLNGNEAYGDVRASILGGNVDAERIRRTGSDWRESGKFIVLGETNPRLVENYKVISEADVGTLVGKTGVTTGTTRGYITRVDYSPSGGDYPAGMFDFVLADYCAADGDSGGSVFRNNTAWGIHSGSFTGQPCTDRNGDWVTGPDVGPSIFGRIDVALDALNVELRTNNLRPQGYPTSTCSQLSCNFSEGTSTDWDGTITSYAWNFGDGTTSSSQNPTHTYSSPGIYTATLTTTDNNGATRDRTLTLDLKLYPPTLDSVTPTAAVCSKTLEWTPPSGGLDPDGYRIYRSLTSTGGWSLIAVVGAVPTSYTDTTVGTATSYWYMIKSRLGTWISVASNTRSADTGLCV